MALALALSLLHTADARSSVITPELGRQLAAAETDETTVVLMHGADATAAKAAALSRRLLVLEAWERVGIVAAMGTPEQIRSLDGAAGIMRLEGNEPIDLATDTSHIATRGAEAIKGFTVAKPEPAKVRGLDGKGVTIAVIDTGIDGTHPSFQQGGESKVVRNMKLACVQPLLNTSMLFEGLPDLPPSSCPNDYDAGDDPWLDFTAINETDTVSLGGHGTHVAATAAGVPVRTADERRLHGAAPGAKLVGLSIGLSLAVYGGASAMNWVLENHKAPCGAEASKADCPPIKVVNNSWGSAGEFDPEDALSKLSDALVADGITIAWSAGNSGGDGASNAVGHSAQNPTPGVIAVANYDDGNRGDRDNQLDDSSSRGEQGRPGTYPDISAPGTLITAACRPYLTICMTGFDADPNYNTISGTSMAAPHIAGIVAQLLQANPRLKPRAIEHVLEDTAHRFKAGGTYERDPRNPATPTSFDKGHGLVDVVAAVSAIRGYTAPRLAPVCAPDGPVVVDRKGDATAFGVDLAAAGHPSEPSLDIRKVTVAWNGQTRALKVNLYVTDLSETNPPPSPGIGFEVAFGYDDATHELAASRHDVSGESFTLDGFDVSGKFNAESDVVSFTVTKKQAAAAGLPPFGSNDVLSDFIARSRYDSGALIGPLADDATGRCPFTIGLGAVPPRATQPAPDGSISVSSRPHTWSGAPTTNLHSDPTGLVGFFVCDGFSGDPCHEEHIKVSVPARGATLDVSIVADIPANDYDLYVLDPDGKEIASSVNFGTVDPTTGALEERVSVPVRRSGVYTVRVVAYATVESTYEGSAALD